MSEKSVKAFIQLKNSLKHYKEHSNGNREFKALIVYDFQGQRLEEVLMVKVELTTIEFGKISISEGDILDSAIVHMGFDAHWQDFSYSSEGFFTIRGVGKIGMYKVKIIEI